MLQAILARSLSQLNPMLTGIYIIAAIECNTDRKPEEVKLRIPHPDGKTPSKVTGGVYDKTTESVIIKPFTGRADIRIEY